MDINSESWTIPRLRLKDLSEQTWDLVNRNLVDKFKDFHTLIGSSIGNLGAIGDAIGKQVYEEVSQHCQPVESTHNTTWTRKRTNDSLLQSAKAQVKIARDEVRRDVNKHGAFQKLNQALRAHREISKKVEADAKAKEQSYHEKLFNKDFYGYIDKFLKKSDKSDIQSDSATKDSVTNKLKEIYSSAPRDLDTSWWLPYQQPTAEFNSTPIRPWLVKKTVSKMRNFSAPGPDGLQPIMLKKLSAFQHVLSTFFSKLLSSNGAEVPSSCQKGKVIFIHKKGDHNDITNYRPIYHID